MADPYATRTPDLSGRPVGPAPWRELIIARGGAFVDSAGVVAGELRLVAIECRGVGTLAPFARVDPALGVLLWLEHTPASRTASLANELHVRLKSLGVPIYAIKHGCIGGPAERPGCFEVGVELIDAVLGAAVADEIAWEIDPDFGYEVAARVPGVEGERARALLPRLLYSDNDRVYEHAELVVAKKRERATIAAGIEGLDVAIARASGWPPEPSPSDWRE